MALGIKEKSENFNSLRQILFELCKLQGGGGVKLTPPPSRNRVNVLMLKVKTIYLTKSLSLNPKNYFGI